MKYTRILGVAAALLVTSAVASQAMPPPVAAPPASVAPAAPASVDGPSAATVVAAPDAAAAPVTALAPETPATWGDAEAGQAKAGVCAACHGADGNSADPLYPKLAGQQERFIARQLHFFKAGERENAIMQPMAAALSSQDMRDLGAYYAAQKPASGVADESPIAAGPNAGLKFWQLGERVYRAGNAKAGVPACLACHGPVGRGNPGPAWPSITGQHAAYTTARLNYFRAGGDKARLTSPMMVDIAMRLSEEEIQGLATYIEGLHPAAAARKAP